MTMTTYTSLVQIVAGVTCVFGLAMGPRGAQAQQIEGLAPPPSDLITPSKIEPLVPGQMLAGSDFERAQRPFIIQRLTERAYWIEVSGYESTVVVGEEGVMVLDAPCCGRVPNIQTAIGEITDLPVTTLVYSHYHLDHVAGAIEYVEAAGRAGLPLRIVATSSTKAQIEKFGSKIPLPTEVVPVPRGQFEFEGMTVTVGTPPSGHTVDNSWILVEDEQVLHNVDLVHPGYLEFMDFGVAEDIDGYEKSVRDLLLVDWEILTAGHSNPGTRADVQLVLDYLGDIRRAVGEAMAETPFAPFVQEDRLFYEWIADFRDAVIENAVKRMRPKWGQYPAFDAVTHTHAQAMFFEIYLH